MTNKNVTNKIILLNNSQGMLMGLMSQLEENNLTAEGLIEDIDEIVLN